VSPEDLEAVQHGARVGASGVPRVTRDSIEVILFVVHRAFAG
jgi:hypothetical protein